MMVGNTRQFTGFVTGVDTFVAHDLSRRPACVECPEVTVEVPDLGTFTTVALTDDVDEACALVGRRVRVTVEVMDR